MGAVSRVVPLSSVGFRVALAILLCTAAAGCANLRPAQIIDRTLDPKKPGASVDATLKSQSDRDGSEMKKPELRQHGHIPAEAATQQLLTAVNVEIERGNYDVATASIERVLQINPDDAWAWHKLAQLHFVRENYTQAKSIALRSNALPSVTGRVAAANWFLIADIARATGDLTAANVAYGKAKSQLNSEP